MTNRRNLLVLMALSIALTVIPSTLCLVVLGLGTFGATLGNALLVILPAMILIGGLIGLGTGVILPTMKWLVLVGTQLGWFGGLLLAVFILELLPASPHDNQFSYGAYALLICCGVVAGLSPTLIVRFVKGGR